MANGILKMEIPDRENKQGLKQCVTRVNSWGGSYLSLKKSKYLMFLPWFSEIGTSEGEAFFQPALQVKMALS